LLAAVPFGWGLSEAERDVLHRRLHAFFEEEDPKKGSRTLKKLLKKYKNKEGELLARVEKDYGRVVPGLIRPASALDIVWVHGGCPQVPMTIEAALVQLKHASRTNEVDPRDVVLASSIDAYERQAPILLEPTQLTKLHEYRDEDWAAVQEANVMKYPSTRSLIAIYRAFITHTGLIFNSTSSYPFLQYRRPKEWSREDFAPACQYQKAVVSLLWDHDYQDYHHFLVETIPRILDLKEEINKRDLKVLWRFDTRKQIFVIPTLKALGFDPLNFITASKDSLIATEIAYLPLWAPKDPDVGDTEVPYRMPRANLLATRRAFLPVFPAPEKRQTVVHLSRAGFKQRDMKNERGFVDLLRKNFGDNVVTFIAEKSTLAATLSVFSHAAVIVGVHGGAFSNLIFCGEGTKVLELMPEDHPKMFYYHLSTALVLEYHLMLVKGNFFEKVEVDLTTLQTALATLDIVLEAPVAAEKCDPEEHWV
jgi:capsular polysaccharide biosynthesis protein